MKYFATHHTIRTKNGQMIEINQYRQKYTGRMFYAGRLIVGTGLKRIGISYHYSLAAAIKEARKYIEEKKY